MDENIKDYIDKKFKLIIDFLDVKICNKCNNGFYRIKNNNLSLPVAECNPCLYCNNCNDFIYINKSNFKASDNICSIVNNNKNNKNKDDDDDDDDEYMGFGLFD